MISSSIGDLNLNIAQKVRQVCLPTFTIADYFIFYGEQTMSLEVAFGFCLKTE